MIPQAGDIVRIRTEAVSEVLVKNLAVNNNVSNAMGKDINVLSVVFGQDGVRVEYQDTEGSRFIWLEDNGVAYPGKSHGLTEPLLELVTRASEIHLYCSCDSPKLVTRTVLGSSYQYCTKCKKERR